MKKILLLLCALMFAAPVYAADPAPAAGATQAEPAAKPAKETPKKAKKKKQKKAAAKSAAPASTLGCPTGCTTMNCPPPSGPSVCCKKTPTGYVTC